MIKSANSFVANSSGHPNGYRIVAVRANDVRQVIVDTVAILSKMSSVEESEEVLQVPWSFVLLRSTVCMSFSLVFRCLPSCLFVDISTKVADFRGREQSHILERP